MYADDIILLAETEEGLKLMINELHAWCKKWRMVVNIEKTQVIHFRPKRAKKTNSKFCYGNSLLEVVSNYRYLGVIVSEHLDQQVIGNTLADGATRALGKLLSKYYLNKGLGLKMYTKFYDTCISPIMDYCSGVWGYDHNNKLHAIHLRTMRCYLGVNKYATKVAIEGELGWAAPQIRRMLNMLRLWNKIVSMENTRLPKLIYEQMLASNSIGTWTRDLKCVFERIKCNDILENNIPVVNIKVFLNHAKERLMSDYVIKWRHEIENKPKLRIYGQYKNEFTTETYCNMNLKGHKGQC
jgi:hypothetical protein